MNSRRRIHPSPKGPLGCTFAPLRSLRRISLRRNGGDLLRVFNAAISAFNICRAGPDKRNDPSNKCPPEK